MIVHYSLHEDYVYSPFYSALNTMFIVVRTYYHHYKLIIGIHGCATVSEKGIYEDAHKGIEALKRCKELQRQVRKKAPKPRKF